MNTNKPNKKIGGFAMVNTGSNKSVPSMPAPIAELPPCPDYLGKKARKHWNEVGPLLVDLGLMTAVDGSAFAIHCSNVEKLQILEEKFKDTEPHQWLTVLPNKIVIENVLFKMRDHLQDKVLKSAKEFGMTPQARTKIKTQEAEKQLGLFDDNDPFAGMTKQ